MQYQRNTRPPARTRSVQLVAFEPDKDKPRDVANTLDTCQEKYEIDAGTNRKGKGPCS